jgi:phosphoribosylformimino-5-aminoimidazole carboxamide ribotide isomerase
VEIIPVIDLLRGQVVRAVRGERSRYQPIRSQLCDSSDPLENTRALLGLYPFKKVYIADLDAIQGTGDNLDQVANLHEHFPDVDVWLDAAIRHPEQLLAVRNRGLGCVVGSEQLESLLQYEQLAAIQSESAMILSLDFNASGFMGPQELLHNPDLWPSRLICMTLSRVGSYLGPDLETLSTLTKKIGQRQLYAAGGIRDINDLQTAKQLGVKGVLLASSLHDNRISATQIEALGT